DVSACPEWLAHHRLRHSAQPSGQDTVVLGRLYDVYADPPPSYTHRGLGETSDRNLAGFPDRGIPGHGELGLFPDCGMNSSIRRGACLGGGGFDSSPALKFGEDVELGVRLLNRGFRMLYEPGAIVYHRDPKISVQSHLRLAASMARSDLYAASVKQQRTPQNQ